MNYPLSKDGVFTTIQGEGLLSGLPMVFVRLAGCRMSCPSCDTDYSVHRRAEPDQIADEVESIITAGVEWLWITGGEPTDHDLDPLLRSLRKTGLRLALATSGVKKVTRGSIYNGVDFVSVSPHDPKSWVLRSGDQLNIVPGLNGFGLNDFAEIAWQCKDGFNAMYVTPCDGKPETVEECSEWVKRYPGWRMGWQAHKQWGMP